MISQKLQDAINEQINREFFSEYLYLSMAAAFDDMNLEGFSNFMKVQAEEERFHMMKFYNYLIERGGRVILKGIPDPQSEFEGIIDIFEKSYGHEQFITKSINELMHLAVEEKDYALQSFLQWFIDEQVEEEASMDSILSKLKLVGEKGNALFFMDKELAARTFTAPAQ
jgi:ferritin